jgi:hypothetical protein
VPAGLCLYSFPEGRFERIGLIGRPGSGKGYLCQLLVRLPGWTSKPGAGQAGRWWLAPISIITAPIVSFLAIAAASTRMPPDFRRYRQVVRVIRKYDVVRRQRGPGLLIADEGPIHALFNVFFWSAPTAASRYFTRQLLRILARHFVAIVYLDIGKTAALENTRRRNHAGSWFNDDMSDEVAERFIRDSSYDEIVDALKSVAPRKLHEFSNVEDAREFLVSRNVSRLAGGEPTSAHSWKLMASRAPKLRFD